MPPADQSLEDLKKQQAIADAEKAALDSETARNESLKKHADSQLHLDPTTKAHDAEMAAAKSAKELADARKAQADSELAALKAKIGEVPSSAITGNVKLEQGAASLETAFLAAVATATASANIAQEVLAIAPDGAKILIFAVGEIPDFQAVTGFFAQRALVLQALTNANSLSEEASKKEGIPLIAGAGVALDAVTKLLGFFKSDFEVRGSDVPADHSLLAKAVAGELLKRTSGKNPKPMLYLKGTFNPSAVAAVGATFKTELESLTFQRGKATTASTDLENRISALRTNLSAITDTSTKDQDDKRLLGEQLNRFQGSVDKLKSAVAAYDTLVAKLVGPETNLAAMIRELDVWNALRDPSSLLLLVKMDKAGGSNYVQKNLWTWFGKMPFKVMGGVIASYTLFQGNTGAVLAAGIVPVHGGFSDANLVGKLVK